MSNLRYVACAGLGRRVRPQVLYHPPEQGLAHSPAHARPAAHAACDPPPFLGPRSHNVFVTFSTVCYPLSFV